jgi:hypothetical protein
MRYARSSPARSPSGILLAFLLIILTICDRLDSLEQNNPQLSSKSSQLQLPSVAPFDISFSEFKKAHGKKYSTVV